MNPSPPRKLSRPPIRLFNWVEISRTLIFFLWESYIYFGGFRNNRQDGRPLPRIAPHQMLRVKVDGELFCIHGGTLFRTEEVSARRLRPSAIAFLV